MFRGTLAFILLVGAIASSGAHAASLCKISCFRGSSTGGEQAENVTCIPAPSSECTTIAKSMSHASNACQGSFVPAEECVEKNPLPKKK